MKKKNRRWQKGKAYGIIAALAAALLCLAALGARAMEPGFPDPSASGEVPEAKLLVEENTAASATGGSSAVKKDQREGFLLDVPFISQTESWPTGCESVCAVMALRYAGVEVTVDEFIDSYLPLGSAPYEDGNGVLVGCDPRRAFPGDPRSEQGWGCYAPVILEAAEQLLRDREETSLSIRNLSDRELDELCEDYVACGTPVLVWATINMEEPTPDIVFLIEDTGEEFQWIYPLHCLLLVGWDDTGYLFNDPMSGKAVHYSRSAVERCYAGLGKQALAVVSS